MAYGSSFAKSVAQSIAPLIDLVYPPRCPLCGAATAEQGGLCAPCWSSLVIPGEPSCASCSRPFPPDFMKDDEIRCAQCLAKPPRHSGICAARIYNDASRKLLLAFKHGGKIALARQLARLIAAKIPPQSGRAAILIPVPLHRWRLWRRGYNQSALLAVELEKLGCGKALVDGLVRQKPTPMLGGLLRSARERALSGAIQTSAKRIEKIRGRDVVLVDDVLTSGATSDACTKALLKAGATSVSIACFARVMNEVLHGDAAALRETKT
ncbi:MAG: ComF family protein [Altererythrobacter sp.]|nr:ComF family protein [Altererythrobacter sp.]MBO6945933.1 ComF family protein [Altererythrobacter sp.]